MSLRFHTLTVSEVVEETADSRSFVFDLPESLRETFTYEAGQFLTFEVPFEDFRIRRCYSFSSAPETDAKPRITVKRVPGGRMSNLLVDTVRPGDTLEVSPPEGRFVLQADADDRPLCLYAGGSGITPALSLLKSALARTTRSVHLVYANRDEASIIFAHALGELVRTYPDRLHVHHHLDAEAGFLTDEAVRALFAGHEAGDHYVCGPAPFMDTVERAFDAAGIDRSRRHFERFVSPEDPDRRAPEAVIDTTTVDVPATFLVRQSGKDHVVPYLRGKTLLESARAAGVDAPSSCEDGYCGACMAQKRSGDVAMRRCTALSDSEVAQGRILTCQSLPTSAEPLVVDYDAVSFSLEAARPEGTPKQPMGPRILAVVCVTVVMILFFLFRTRG